MEGGGITTEMLALVFTVVEVVVVLPLTVVFVVAVVVFAEVVVLVLTEMAWRSLPWRNSAETEARPAIRRIAVVDLSIILVFSSFTGLLCFNYFYFNKKNSFIIIHIHAKQ